jgi:hypothetical protein
MKIRPVGAEFFHTDRQTYMTKLKVAFRDFANGPKNQEVPSYVIPPPIPHPLPYAPI